ncbi:MAG TPA: hypothetical protein VL049_15660 [Candidatus Dormibacteraeota bacterium]|nr:hypothetical protein [Candidatus Dormibacteraeota bacterium]
MCAVGVVGAMGTQANAQFVGRATIKATRVVDGIATKIKCGGSLQLNTVEWQPPMVGNPTAHRFIDFDPACPLNADVDVLTFTGREQEGGVDSHRFLFTGIIGADTDDLTAMNVIDGGFTETLRFAGAGASVTFTTSDGIFHYGYRNSSSQQVQVSGRIKARCDDSLGFCTP